MPLTSTIYISTENRYTDVHSGHPQLCGNVSGSLTCPDNYVCQQNPKIENPNYGITSFDTIFASFLTVFRLAGRDYWEEVLRNLIATAGPWHIISFIFVIVYCSLQLVALIWAQIAVSYKYLEHERWENDLLNDLHEVPTVRQPAIEFYCMPFVNGIIFVSCHFRRTVHHPTRVSTIKVCDKMKNLH